MIDHVVSSLSSSKETGKGQRNRGLIPIDYLVLAYSSLTTFLLAVSDNARGDRLGWIGFNLCAIVAVLAIRRIDTGSPVFIARMLRRLYPLLLFTFFYEQTQSLVHVFFPGWFDAAVAQLETAAIGVQPALVVGQYYAPWINEIVIGSYVSYYLWLPTAAIAFWLLGKQSSADRLITASALAFFVSYTIFYLYPVEGPRYHFAGQLTQQLDGLVFVPLVHWIMNNAAVHGGAMPSSHTAVALIVLIAVFRESRRWGVVLAVPAVGIAVGCVWGQFHYVLDVVAGILLGILAIWLTEQIFQRNLLGSRRLKGNC